MIQIMKESVFPPAYPHKGKVLAGTCLALQQRIQITGKRDRKLRAHHIQFESPRCQV